MSRPRLYHCSDGFCGADDCSTCFPGNEYEREVRAIEPDEPDLEPEPTDAEMDRAADAYFAERSRMLDGKYEK